jgi:minor extracellular protease Epr
MTKFLLTASLIALLFCSRSLGSTIKVAVIDTGIDAASSHDLCTFGHKSFVNNSSPLKDTHGHGTHIAGLISKYAGKGDWCMVAIKFYDPDASSRANLESMRQSIQYAIDLKVDYINISGGGFQPNDGEKALIIKALNKGIKVVVAAGNGDDNHVAVNLDKDCSYFPACYDKRILVVGNLKDTDSNPDFVTWSGEKLSRAPSSNYGSYVKRWEVGTNVESTLPGNRRGRMTGTSQATAIVTGKLLNKALQIQ